MIRALTLVAILATGLTGVVNSQEVRKDPLYKPGDSSIMGVNHVSLTVRNLDAARAFYTGSFGLQPQGAVKPLSGRYNALVDTNIEGASLQRLQGPNSFLQLIDFGDADAAKSELPVQGPGITHVCYIAAIDKPLDGKAIDAGASWQSTSKAMVDMRGVGYMYGYLRDPDGVMFEIEHNPDPSMDVDLWMGHVGIMTHDLTGIVEFYKKVLGFDPSRRVDNVSGPTFDLVGGIENGKIHMAWFRVSPFYNLELMEYANPRTQASKGPTPMDEVGYKLIAFETSNLASDVARLKSENIEMLTEVVPVEGGKAIYLRDPDGNLLSITEFEKGSPLSLAALPMYQGRKP